MEATALTHHNLPHPTQTQKYLSLPTHHHSSKALFEGHPSERPAQWSPYMDNGGTTASIAGRNFVIVAGDTRLNGSFSIFTRNDPSKLIRLTKTTYLASTGMQADRLQLQEVLKHRILWYKYNNSNTKKGTLREPSTRAIAQLLSTILYQRRFFPYYTVNMIVGLDEPQSAGPNSNEAEEDRQGVCFSYDPVGSTEPLQYGTRGSAASFIEPLLDCMLLKRHQTGRNSVVDPNETLPLDNKVRMRLALTCAEALDILKMAFKSAAERDIFTGDSVCFHILTPAGVTTEYLELRKD